MSGMFRPAWMAGLLGSVLLMLASSADAQSRRRPAPNYLGGHTPDQVEGARILEDMRAIGLGGAYYQEFDLILLPRKAAASRQKGRWFGARNQQGPVTRVEIGVGKNEPPEILLVQNGPEPEVWRLGGGSGPEEITGADVLQPLAGTTLSAADLQIPFMYWKDFAYEGRERIDSRPSYAFLLYPPAENAASYPEIGGARVFIDTQYHVPIRAQWVDDEGRPLKSITVLSFQKIEEQVIVKSFEVRDERTRDKTRFLVTAVALDAEIPEEYFTPSGPSEPAPFDLPPGKLVSLQQQQ